MLCQACKTENTDQTKFCMGCGDALQNLCPECGTELPPDAKFCFSCGAKIGAPSESPEPIPALITTGQAPPPTAAESEARSTQPYESETRRLSHSKTGNRARACTQVATEQ
ncbi:MAG TPA: zinc-ribbon domain-containing protein [Dehalococcoidia bacterium]|nr:zinc-ribbon domain-containing protein [Dehalococcoidia bacterium]HIK89818.1 zinc-ribbon domain-containing protein [Dehalococcoidia bacterium]